MDGCDEDCTHSRVVSIKNACDDAVGCATVDLLLRRSLAKDSVEGVRDVLCAVRKRNPASPLVALRRQVPRVKHQRLVVDHFHHLLCACFRRAQRSHSAAVWEVSARAKKKN